MTGVIGGSGSTAVDAVRRPPADAELFASVVGLDVDALDDHEVLEAMADCERVLARVVSVQLGLAAELARRPARIDVAGEDPVAVRAGFAPRGQWVREFADDEVAARLKVSQREASARIRTGCALERMPITREALRFGRIDGPRARVMVEETAALDPAAAREVEASTIGFAQRLAPARLRPKARAAVIALDPVVARQRCARARGERRVVITPAADGMAEVWAHLPAVAAASIDAALSSAARASRAGSLPGDDRTMDQRRADLFAGPFLDALVTGELAGQRLARHRGRPAEVQVTVAASTLLGLDDAPAQLRGYGPITAEVARDLAPDARWRRILTDPATGAVLDVGTTTYRPPRDLTRHVEVRDQLCTFPGCGWPAAACDLDHTVPFPEGSTSAGNLVNH